MRESHTAMQCGKRCRSKSSCADGRLLMLMHSDLTDLRNLCIRLSITLLITCHSLSTTLPNEAKTASKNKEAVDNFGREKIEQQGGQKKRTDRGRSQGRGESSNHTGTDMRKNEFPVYEETKSRNTEGISVVIPEADSENRDERRI